ncbi:MAG: sulfatase [Akkermansiaceae bacterium]|jgi:arylsulfatase A-like enzyme
MRSLLLLLFAALISVGTTNAKPNVVIIFLDDSGFGDFHPFGKPTYPTPNVVRLAKEGMRLNQFYVPQAVCSASRSALMSGCYPGRTKVFGAHGPNGKGLDPRFATMAEVFKKNGYATAHYGKWHCGDTPATRPQARGFDEHGGLMISNDMWRFHPVNPKQWSKHPLPYWRNDKITIENITKKDQTQLTKWATEQAVDFIKRKHESPFFVYLAHSMPHVPLFCSDEFLGKSGAGLYGDVIMEIDWSVGEIMKVLREKNVEKETIVIFSSDNGPWSQYGDHAGTTPFREHKATGFDGGIRSATLMKYPGKLKAGSTLERPVSSIDLLPTLAHLTGSKLPANEIDGKNVWSIITGEKDAKPAHEYYPFSTGRTFEGVISGDGRWKLHLPHRYRSVVEYGKGGQPGRTVAKQIEFSLFDLKNDPKESTNVMSNHPEVAKRLEALALKHRKEFYGKK